MTVTTIFEKKTSIMVLCEHKNKGRSVRAHVPVEGASAISEQADFDVTSGFICADCGHIVFPDGILVSRKPFIPRP